MLRPLAPLASSDKAAAAFDVVALAGANSAVAPAPHSALRKSFHFMPFSASASSAAWYLALHSLALRPLASPASSGNAAVAGSLAFVALAGASSAVVAPGPHSALRK